MATCCCCCYYCRCRHHHRRSYPRNSRRAIRKTGETLPAGSRRRRVLDNAAPFPGAGTTALTRSAFALAASGERQRARAVLRDLFETPAAEDRPEGVCFSHVNVRLNARRPEIGQAREARRGNSTRTRRCRFSLRCISDAEIATRDGFSKSAFSASRYISRCFSSKA